MATHETLKAPLPEGITLADAPRLCVEADLRPDGTFGQQWLVVTQDTVYVFACEEQGMTACHTLPLAEITEAKAEGVVGGGTLEVRQGDAQRELLRFTSSRLPRFTTAATLIGKWAQGEDEPIPEEEQQRCPRCGFPLEAGSKVCPACLPKSRALKRLIAYLRPYWPVAVGMSALSLLNTGLSLLPPYLQKPLLDTVLNPTNPAAPETRLQWLGYLALGLAGAYVLMSLGGIAQGWLSAMLGNNITHDIRAQLYERLHYLSLRFFDKRQIGSIISRVNQDTGQLQHFLVWGSQDLANNVLKIIGISVILFTLNWKLALLVLVPAPIVALASLTFWQRARFFMHRVFRQWGRVNALVTEALNGLRVVRAFAQEPREVGRFRRQSQDVAVASMRAERAWSTLFGTMTMVIMLSTMLIWYIGGRQVIYGGMSAGSLFAFIAYVGMFFGPVQAMSMLLNWSSRSLTAAERVFEVLDAEQEVREADDAVAMPEIRGHVEFRDVQFGYERHRPTLKGVNFAVQPGEMIGLVGHSGAGKSTTMNLLCRFYDVNEGAILIDGVPINKLRVEDLRRQIGFVPQDTFLFSGTIAENIAYGKPEATYEEIIRAAKVANAHDFIRKKPDGYETHIGEGGKGLSGGEKQRLAIARAVLHDPRILILDEATSHVDVETEKQIQEATARLIAGRTTFAIAHRLSTLKHANRLLVLKNGEIAEIGTHDELLAKEDGEFHRLVKTYQEISKVREIER